MLISLSWCIRKNLINIYWENLKEAAWGWINGGRKDCGFGWGKIRDGGEQLV